MRKIIKNKVYDTEKAKLIGSREILEPNENGYTKESMHKKHTGEFFLFKQKEDGSGKIFPVSIDEAKDWIQKYCGNAYQNMFTSADDTKKIYTSFSIDPEVAMELTRMAKSYKLSRSAMVEKIIHDTYKREKAKGNVD